MSASLGLRWWHHMNVRGLQNYCIATLVTCSIKTILITRIPLCPSYPSITKLYRRDVRSKTYLIRQAVRLKDRLLNVFKHIHHRSFFPLGQLYVAFYRSSSSGKVASRIFEGHRQGTENDCFITSSTAH